MFDVITIGSATRDIFLQSLYFKVLRDPKHLKKIGFPAGEAQCFAMGSKIDIGRPIFTTGGGATNTAVTFARQGLKTAALIKTGNDESGENILDELKKEKIGVFSAKDKKLGTGYDTILLSNDGERTILVYRGASSDLAEKDIPFDKIKSKWAYISPGNIPFKVIDLMVNFLHKNGVNIAINPSKKMAERKISGLKNILSKSKVVIMNREEASILTGIDYWNARDIFKKLDKAVSGIAVMTDGSQGVGVSDGYHIYQTGILKEKFILDRTGAGDAFGSGFVAGLIKKSKIKNQKSKFSEEEIKYAIRLGSANATSVIEKIGAKEGILMKRDFENNPRWRRLSVKISKLS